MRRVEPDPDESRRKLWRAENSLTTHARCSPPGLSRIASLIGKIQACRPVDHSSGANGCFSSCGGNAHPDREWQRLGSFCLQGPTVTLARGSQLPLATEASACSN